MKLVRDHCKDASMENVQHILLKDFFFMRILGNYYFGLSMKDVLLLNKQFIFITWK